MRNGVEFNVDTNVRIIATVDGEVTDDVSEHNMVTDQGLNRICQMLVSSRIINRMLFGTGSNPVSVNDTTLQTPVGSPYSIIQSNVSSRTITLLAIIPTPDLHNVLIREVGLIDSSGDMVARMVLPAGILKTNQKAVQATWSIIIGRV